MEMDFLVEYLWQFGLNVFLVGFIVMTLYRRRKPSRTYAVALIVGAELIYIIITLMLNVEISLGVGFGILAIFSLLRFRTVEISLRDMTYLFVVFTLSMVNALFMELERWEEMAVINLAVLLTLMVLESGRIMPNRSSIKFTLDNLSLLHASNQANLMRVVEEHSGITPVRITVDHVDIGLQQATLKVYYVEEDRNHNGKSYYLDEEHTE